MPAAVRRRRRSRIAPATAECRTSDITLAEFKTLTGKMDAFNPAHERARNSSAARPTSAPTSTQVRRSGHLLTHKESIELFKKLGVKMTPELKSSERGDAVRRLHAGAVRAEDDRRVQGGRRLPRQGLAAVVRQERRAVLDRQRAGVRQAGRLPRRRRSTWPTCRPSPTSSATSAQGINIVGPPIVRAARSRRGRQHRASQLREGREARPVSTSSPGRSSAPASSPTATTASTTRRSTRPSSARAT